MSVSPTLAELETLLSSYNPLHIQPFQPISLFDEIFNFLNSERTCINKTHNMWDYTIVEDYPRNFAEFTSTFLHENNKNQIILKIRRQGSAVDINLCIMVDGKNRTQMLKFFSDFQSFQEFYIDLFENFL